jgi:hypothetical protein
MPPIIIILKIKSENWPTINAKMFLYVFFISLQRNRFYVSFVYSANELDKGNVHLDVFLPQLPIIIILKIKSENWPTINAH